MRRAGAAAAVLLLAACQPQATADPAPQAPAPGAAAAPVAKARGRAAFEADIQARGANWSLAKRGLAFTLSEAGAPEVIATARRDKLTDARAEWRAKARDGETVTVILFASDCAYGYTMTAEVQIRGRTLHGCAVAG